MHFRLEIVASRARCAHDCLRAPAVHLCGFDHRSVCVCGGGGGYWLLGSAATVLGWLIICRAGRLDCLIHAAERPPATHVHDRVQY